jgi:hypothetical protein
MRTIRDMHRVLHSRNHRQYFCQPKTSIDDASGLADTVPPTAAIICGPASSGSLGLDLVKREVCADIYINDWRLEQALEGLINNIL